MSEPPRVIRKRKKGAVKHVRSKRKNKGKKKQKKKKKNQINNKKKKGGQNCKVNACAPVSCRFKSRQQRLETSRDYRMIGKIEERWLEALLISVLDMRCWKLLMVGAAGESA